MPYSEQGVSHENRFSSCPAYAGSVRLLIPTRKGTARSGGIGENERRRRLCLPILWRGEGLARLHFLPEQSDTGPREQCSGEQCGGIRQMMATGAAMVNCGMGRC